VFHLTNGRSNTRESATEIRLLRLTLVKGEKVRVRDHQSLWQHRELENPTWQQETDGQRLTSLLFR